MRLHTLVRTLAIIGIVACDREGADVSAGSGEPAPSISVERDSAAGVAVTIGGLSRAQVARLEKLATAEAWQAVMRVSVEGADHAPMLGEYRLTKGQAVFRPAFAFDPGRAYRVTVRLDSAGGESATSIDTVIVPIPSVAATNPTLVTRVYPTVDTLPENLLRLYVDFSAPMSRVGALPYVSLVDENNHTVRDAFLPLDADFWSRDRTSYTLLLDPGRVKQGIRPNEEMGRALRAGKRYTLVIDSLWPDENGRPLGASFRKTFVAGAPSERAIAADRWRYELPAAGTRSPLVVRFEAPLDARLVQRALGVESDAGVALEGESSVLAGERAWQFVPRVAWGAGAYRLLVLTVLEDVAGNRVDRPFEVDRFDRVDPAGRADRRYYPLRIR